MMISSELSSMHPPLPFPRSYWVQPGRFLGGFFPGDADTVQAHAKLPALAGCGVTHVINLMEADERDHSARLFADYSSALQQIALQRGVSIGWTRRPIPDLGVPEISEMVQILDLVDAAMRDGCVYVHCRGGRGRTGTVVGCWLARHRKAGGSGVLDCLKQLTAHNSSAFPHIPEMEVQREFVRQWRAGQ